MVTQLKATRTEDWQVVVDILTHPSVLPHVSDDSGFKLDVPLISENLYWILIHDGDELLGMFLAHPQNMVTYEVHTCLLPNAYRGRSKQAAESSLQWMFDNTSCLKITTNVPEYNKLALRFARLVGLQNEGINRKSYMKNKQLMDQYVLGITKEEFLCQH